MTQRNIKSHCYPFLRCRSTHPPNYTRRRRRIPRYNGVTPPHTAADKLAGPLRPVRTRPASNSPAKQRHSATRHRGSAGYTAGEPGSALVQSGSTPSSHNQYQRVVIDRSANTSHRQGRNWRNAGTKPAHFLRLFSLSCTCLHPNTVSRQLVSVNMPASETSATLHETSF